MIQKNIQIHALESEQIFRRSDDEKDTIKVAGNCEVGRGHVLHLQRKKVTIVFVPGIMASRLVDQDNSMVWDPDWGAGPEKRQALLLKKITFRSPAEQCFAR